MTTRRPPAPRQPVAAPPRRWPLALGCLVLASAGAYWLQSKPAPRPSERSATASHRAAPPPSERREARAPQPAAAAPERGTARRELAPADEGAATAPPAELDEFAEPEGAEAFEPAPRAAPHPAGSAAAAHEPAVAPEPEASERAARPTPRPRRIELTLLRRWSQPGLCARAEQASEAQRTLMSHFRAAELAGGARLFLDPRLPAGAEQPALEHLEEAQRVLRAELQLSPGVPDVFLYHDVQLLLASACTNADVVAYYDGALHIVVTRDDVRESVLHELTHHALMTAGVLGPAWLQEGMAMHIAGESWWRRPELLQQLIERPFGLDTMETMVPYTLESEHAVLFYAQSAAMIECATREPDSTLGGLLAELNVQQSAGALDYGLPANTELAALRECMRELAQQQPAR